VEVGSRVVWLGVAGDPGWEARIDGRSLAPAELPEPLDWSAAYVVSVEDATAEVVAEFDNGARRLWLLLQGVVILALIILALPERKVVDPDPDDPDDPDAVGGLDGLDGLDGLGAIDTPAITEDTSEVRA
jgi:hypothetical protein